MTAFNFHRLMRTRNRMPTTILAALAVAAAAAMPGQAKAQTSLSEITVSPPDLPPRITDQFNRKGGGDGHIGAGAKDGDNTHGLDRLDQQLKRKVDEINPLGNIVPLDARSPDVKTGMVNIPGVEQQYGQNFGKSVMPYRPPSPVYSLSPRRR
jgi:hypothetical protein